MKIRRRMVGLLLLMVGVTSRLSAATLWAAPASIVTTVPQNDADRWYQQAVQLEKGKKVLRDAWGALRLYYRAALQNHAAACCRIGQYAEKGELVPQQPEEAARWYMKAIFHGNSAEANYRLGLLYYYGEGVPQDWIEAASCYRQAAEQGWTKAAYNLGLLYLNGKGVERQPQTAYYWLLKAAEKGMPAAAYNVGLLLERGVGVTQDVYTAAQWYRRAAQQGFDMAQYSLGLLYQKGLGVPRDAFRAQYWLRKAAIQNYAPAIETLQKMGIRRYRYVDMPLDELTAAADQQDADAQYERGRRCEQGRGVHRDLEAAFRWYHKAAMQDHKLAQREVGRRYLWGQGTSQNDSWAARWLAKATLQGDTEAERLLAGLYASGRGVQRDSMKAAVLYSEVGSRLPAFADNMQLMTYDIALRESLPSLREQAAQGEVEAMLQLATAYQKGWHTEADDAAAIQWYQMAIAHGSAIALVNLAALYYERANKASVPLEEAPSPVAFDNLYEVARKLTERAAQIGNAKAQFNLGVMYYRGDGGPQNGWEAARGFYAAAQEGYPVAAYNLAVMLMNGGDIVKDYNKAIYWFQKAMGT